MGIASSIKWAVDVASGLAKGKYRAGLWLEKPAAELINENDNAHYLQGVDTIRKNIAEAKALGAPSTSYPGFYWVSRFAKEVHDSGRKPDIYDFGGSYGYDFFKLQRFATVPFSYTVAEIPQIVEICKPIEALSEIGFVDSSEPNNKLDILYSNGTTMNASKYLFEFIDRTKPDYIVLSAAECSDDPTFYSVQTLRKTKRRCIYTTYNLVELIEIVESHGYQLQDYARGGEQGSGVFLKKPLKVHYYSMAFRKINRATEPQAHA